MFSTPLTRLLTSNIRSLFEEVIFFSCKVAFPGSKVYDQSKITSFLQLTLDCWVNREFCPIPVRRLSPPSLSETIAFLHLLICMF